MKIIKNIKYLLVLICMTLAMYSFSATADDYSWVDVKLVNHTGKTVEVNTDIFKNKGFQVIVPEGKNIENNQSANIQIGIPVVYREVEGGACSKWISVSGDQGHFKVSDVNDSHSIATFTIDTFDVYGKFNGNSDARMSGLYILIDSSEVYSATSGNSGSGVVNAVHNQIPINDYNLLNKRKKLHNYITYRSPLTYSERENPDHMTIILGDGNIPAPTADKAILGGNKLML